MDKETLSQRSYTDKGRGQNAQCLGICEQCSLGGGSMELKSGLPPDALPRSQALIFRTLRIH